MARFNSEEFLRGEKRKRMAAIFRADVLLGNMTQDEADKALEDYMAGWHMTWEEDPAGAAWATCVHHKHGCPYAGRTHCIRCTSYRRERF